MVKLLVKFFEMIVNRSLNSSSLLHRSIVGLEVPPLKQEIGSGRSCNWEQLEWETS